MSEINETEPLTEISEFMSSETRTSLEKTSSKPPNHRSQVSINWQNSIYLVAVPLVALIGLFWVPLRKETLWFGVGYAVLRALVVTAGWFLRQPLCPFPQERS